MPHLTTKRVRIQPRQHTSFSYIFHNHTNRSVFVRPFACLWVRREYKQVEFRFDKLLLATRTLPRLPSYENNKQFMGKIEINSITVLCECILRFQLSV